MEISYLYIINLKPNNMKILMLIIVLWVLFGFLSYSKFKIQTGHRATLVQDLIGLALSMLTGPLVLLFKK